MIISWMYCFFFKQKTAYEITTGDWSSDVCSSDLRRKVGAGGEVSPRRIQRNSVERAIGLLPGRRTADRRRLGVVVGGQDPALVAVEHARAADGVQPLAERALLGEGEAEVRVARRILAGARRVALR